MKRRSFVYQSGLVTGALLMGPSLFANRTKADPMSRIGMTTVVFRNQFASTNPNAVTNEITLKEIPHYYAERFGIRNIEYWSKHFESREQSYLKELKNSIDKENSTLINIQVDTPGKDLSDPNDGNCDLAIQEIKEWIDVGQFLGSKMVRASSIYKSMDVGTNSLKTLVKYASSRGITLLVENHFDLLSVPQNHVQLAREIKRENFGLLADFGNYPDSVDQYDALKMIAPYTHLVSAKTHAYDENYNHTSFDFDKCVRIMEAGGFKGIYSLEQWEDETPDYDFGKIVDWMIKHVSENLS